VSDLDLYTEYARHQDGRRVCRVCYHSSRQLTDGLCPRCNGDTAELDAERQREAVRRLHADTARLLRRIGHEDEAQYHEERAK
jgi:hypothetical protein